MRIAPLLLCFAIATTSCDKEESGPKNYGFEASASHKLKSSSTSLVSAAGVYKGDDLCTSVICITPDAVSGHYFGAGLLIQSTGKGMSAYFDFESWSEVTTGSEVKEFNLLNPITHSGTIYCCGGEGDLNDENTYFSDASYMFQHLDVTFTIPSSLGMRDGALGSHTVRFVLADNAVETAKRGDILVLDANVYKWMDETGTLSVTRPSAPIKMNAKVVSWTSQFGDGKGNTEIPVLYSGLTEPANGKQTTSEDELKDDTTYSYDFNSSGLVIFPDLLHADGGMVGDLKTLLQKIHLRGLEFGSRGVIGLGKTTLTIE